MFAIVGWAIDFDGQSQRRAVKVENVGPDGVLAAEMEAEVVATKQQPKGALGLCQRATHSSSALANEVR